MKDIKIKYRKIIKKLNFSIGLFIYFRFKKLKGKKRIHFLSATNKIKLNVNATNLSD